MPVLKTSKLLLPYEPGYTGHWEGEKRRKEIKAWLRQREREIGARASRERQTVAPRSCPTIPNSIL
jgi:ribosomal protein S6E (S10)